MKIQWELNELSSPFFLNTELDTNPITIQYLQSELVEYVTRLK